MNKKSLMVSAVIFSIILVSSIVHAMEPRPSIIVLSPIGENWTNGQDNEIRWHTTGFQGSERVSISLIDPNAVINENCEGCPSGNWYIGSSNDTGEYIWNTKTVYGASTGPNYPIELSIQNPKQYRIVVSAGVVEGKSELFTIYPSNLELKQTIFQKIINWFKSLFS